MTVLLVLLALCGAVIFWHFLVNTIIEWRYMETIQRVSYIFASAMGFVATVVCSHIIATCL